MTVDEAVAGYNATVNGEYTFAGVLQKHIEDIAVHWCERTRSNYLRDYRGKILPYFVDKPLRSFDLKDCEKIIDLISKKNAFSEATKNHYRLLIRKVFEVASKYGLADNEVWASEFSRNKTISLIDEVKQVKLKTVRYFDVEMEYKLYDSLCIDFKQDGVMFGLMLMFVTGVRNQEAVAIRYEDIKIINDHPYISIINSLSRKTHKFKLGTKTKNGYRLIPLPHKIYNLIMHRKAWIQSLIDSGTIVLKGTNGIHSIDQMPIACDGGNNFAFIDSNKMSRAGKKLFQTVNMSEDMMKLLNSDMENDYSDSMCGYYKDPTAYAFRRAYVTHLIQSGASPEQCKYLVGHVIHGKFVQKSDYSNPDELEKLRLIMCNRPIINDVPFGGYQVNICENSRLFENVHRVFGTISTKNREGQSLMIRIIQNESHEKGEYSLRLNNPDSVIKGSYCQTPYLAIKKIADVGVHVERNNLYDYWKPYYDEFKRRGNR